MQEFDSGPVTGVTVVATVKWYDPVKGYGFLTPADGSRDVFCHVSAVSRAGLLTLGEGATVTCEVVQGRQGPRSNGSTPSMRRPRSPFRRRDCGRYTGSKDTRMTSTERPPDSG